MSIAAPAYSLSVPSCEKELLLHRREDDNWLEQDNVVRGHTRRLTRITGEYGPEWQVRYALEHQVQYIEKWYSYHALKQEHLASSASGWDSHCSSRCALQLQPCPGLCSKIPLNPVAQLNYHLLVWNVWKLLDFPSRSNMSYCF